MFLQWNTERDLQSSNYTFPTTGVYNQRTRKRSAPVAVPPFPYHYWTPAPPTTTTHTQSISLVEMQPFNRKTLFTLLVSSHASAGGQKPSGTEIYSTTE
jgi:hypothetical protein